MRYRIVFFLPLLFFAACSPSRNLPEKRESIPGLKFLGEYDVPNALQFNGTTVGGLSGIDRDERRDQYYFISDDRSAINAARFYTAKIDIGPSGIDSVLFTGVTTLLQKDGTPYPNSKQDPLHTPDPEAMRYNPDTDELAWSSEGERNIKPGTSVLEDPSIRLIDRNGHYKDSFELPANMHMSPTEQGPRQNGVFEGISFSGDHKDLFVSVEDPIYEDGDRAATGDSTAWIRLLKFDAYSKKQVAQYAYKVDAVSYPSIPTNAYKINGVSDILWADKDQLIVVERSFSTGRLACTIRVYLADLSAATNVATVSSLHSKPPEKAAQKKLLLNMDELGRYIDNIEGVTFGPILPNGHRTLLFVADDNFSKAERTQILLFEILP